MTRHTLHYGSRRYRQLIEWIADNDNPGDNDPLDAVAGYLTVTMLAHTFNLKKTDVAADVLLLRVKP